MRIVHVVGARPNLVKMAPVIAAVRERHPEWHATVVHTGQHYDRAMSEIFFEQLGVPEPDHMLGVGSGSHAEQAARVLERLEPVLRAERPDLVLVPGDVNSTLAAALCAARLGIAVGHVESGLRSFDRTMPEEINRTVADHLSALCFIHCGEAADNLAAERVEAERVRFVGNTMIDTLDALSERFRAREAARALGLEPGSFLLVTLHRPALVDGPLLGEAIAALERVAAELPVVFPVHPRTRKMLGREPGAGVHLSEPIGYLDFLSLEADAAAVLTDSGGIQEETTYLGVPCFTLRDNTERPVTVRAGTNTLLGLAPERIADIPQLLAAQGALATGDPGEARIASPPGAARSAEGRVPQAPPLWDGRAAQRVADVLAGW
ncbi:MAG: non-hydrolyzing UDP-N-acetylglucosamine 2-epimerase [Solirubrobacterales bacterium]